MASIVNRIKELEETEARYIALKQKVLSDLKAFITAWDEDPGRLLPADHGAKINALRNLHDFCQ